MVKKMVTPRSLERDDELVDVSGGDRVEPGGGLVQEQHRRVVEQRSGQRHPLAKALGERAAEIVGPIGQVDRLQGALDAPVRRRTARRAWRSIRGSPPRVRRR